MPANIIKINNAIEYVVPDSWMPVMMEYLNLMKKITEDEECPQ